MLTPIFLLIIGSLLLYLGAEGLVRGSSTLALRLGISPLVVGLTVVAFGTSAPELVVSLRSALAGNSAISLGNVVGSNICNIGLILGLSALICSLRIELDVIRRQAPIMIVATLVLVVVLMDGRLGRFDGLLLSLGLIGFLAYNITVGRRNATLKADVPASKSPSMPLAVIMSLAGLGLLVLGADFFVKGAVRLAGALGVPETVIALTIVAVGTSLPELATSVVAALKKQADIATGNVIGSNIFNIFGILGVTAVVRPLPADAMSRVDLMVMVGLSLVVLPLMKTDFTLDRWEGGLLLVVYGSYTGYLLFTIAT